MKTKSSPKNIRNAQDISKPSLEQLTRARNAQRQDPDTSDIPQWTDEQFRQAAQQRRGRLADMALAQIRQLAGMTQADLARSMDIQQAAVSKMEHQQDIQVSTLKRVVQALGGELEITVKLPTGCITVSQFNHKKAA